MKFSTAEALTIASFLAVVAKTLVEGLVTPLFDKFKWDKFWLLYVSWGVAAGVVALGQVNLFTGYIANPIVGFVLTALICGGGSNLIHDLFDTKAKRV